MTDAGLNLGQVEQVRGYADQKLRKINQPNDPANRRISLIVEYLQLDGSKSAKDLGTTKSAIEDAIEKSRKPE